MAAMSATILGLLNEIWNQMSINMWVIFVLFFFNTAELFFLEFYQISSVNPKA